MKKILFITKKNSTYGFINFNRKTSGLYNSTRFIVESLNQQTDIEAEIVEVIDNNCIDREVTKFRPDICIIEAFWVVPEKFPILQKLHPKVKWYVHAHSGLPFLAIEGIAIEWMKEYSYYDVGTIANSIPTYEAFKEFLPNDMLVYLPNVYLTNPMSAVINKKCSNTISIGCFGAVRPLKNHLTQAIAALKFSKQIDKFLRFHINSTRLEGGGEPVLKNIHALFADQENAMLIEWPWKESDEFVQELHDSIDLGMQVSFTETFNVVCADYATAGLPIVCSTEVPWMSKLNCADPNNVDEIVNVMHRVYDSKILVKLSQFNLIKDSQKAQRMWARFVRSMSC